MIDTNKKISVVVPVYDEFGNIDQFHRELVNALESIQTSYEIIYVDDNSTDGTWERLQQVQSLKFKIQNYGRMHHVLMKHNSRDDNIVVLRKVGKKGKAYSLVEGFAQARGSTLVMIDSDLQYSPHAIAEMIKKLGKGTDVVVATRKNYRDSRVRKVLSEGFRLVFGRMLFGLRTDIQSGLKVFTREVYQTVKFIPNTPWTFDLEFLHRARTAGFGIADFSITFAPRLIGSSKVSVVKQTVEIGLNALLLRLKETAALAIPAYSTTSMVGAGVGYKKRKYVTHTTLPFSVSALQTFSFEQKLLLLTLPLAIIGGLITWPLPTARLLVAVLSVLYFADALFNLFIVLRSLRRENEIRIAQAALDGLDEVHLPVYTILCPLYKEAHVVPQFLEAIAAIDWPKNKLDVMFLLEEDDAETREAFAGFTLPYYARTVVVPHSLPKTKPKACNYGLSLAKGEYLVIYDAEDIPDPLQLKKAYLGFKKVPANVQCLQAKLNYYNARQNILTRLFTAEYSLWFDVTLTGLQSLNSTIPLGGTSNHFKTKTLRELQGWDPFNVTEDADLGVRLFQRGYQTAIIDSTTLEEATSKPKNWLRQRSRWIKGYMQTYFVHMRHFASFVKQKGLWHNVIFQFTVGGKILFLLLNPLMWVLTILYFTSYSLVGPTIEAIYVPPVSYIAVSSWIFGNFLFLYYYMIGIGKREQWDIAKYTLLIPVYWLMMSAAGAVALYQLIFKPHYWEKTVHGFHLGKRKAQSVKRKGYVSVGRPSVKPAWAARTPMVGFAGGRAKYVQRAQSVRISDNQTVRQSENLNTNYIQVVVNNISSFLSLFNQRPLRKAKREALRVLIFNWRDTKHRLAGGAEVYVQELAARWAKDGNTVTLFCGNDNRNPHYEVVDGVEIIRRGGSYTVYLFAFLYYLVKFRGKYDVVIDCENGIPFFTPLFARIPVVLLIHHVHQEIFRIFLKFPLRHIAAFLEGMFMPLLYKNKQIVTVSDSSKREIYNLGFTDERNIAIVTNGVTNTVLDAYPKTTYPSFLYLGRLKEYKQVDVAIRAFARILPRFPEAVFSIVGSGETYSELIKLVRDLKIEHAVTFYGKVSEEDKAKVLAQSWVAVQPSSLEGWGITVIEANAAGTPVIASKVHGLRDSVVDYQTGLLVPSGDVSEFASAMKLMVEDPLLRQRLSQNALSWSFNFDWDRSAREFYNVLTQAMTVREEKKVYTIVSFEGGARA